MLRISAEQGNRPRDFVRPRRQKIRREAAPIAEGRGLAPRGYARCRWVQARLPVVVRSVISAPPPLRTLITADRNHRTHSAGQIGPRPRRWTLRPAGSGLALTPANRPSFRAVPAAGTRIRCQATRPDAPTSLVAGFAAPLSCRNGRRLRCSQAARLGRRSCCRDRTQHILCVTLRSFIPGAQGTPRPCAGSK